MRVHGHVERMSTGTPTGHARVDGEVERRAPAADHRHGQGELVGGDRGRNFAEVEANRRTPRQGDAIRQISTASRGFVGAEDDPRRGSTVTELRKGSQEAGVEGLDQREQGRIRGVEEREAELQRRGGQTGSKDRRHDQTARRRSKVLSGGVRPTSVPRVYPRVETVAEFQADAETR
jgi:hypothetical protein